MSWRAKTAILGAITVLVSGAATAAEVRDQTRPAVVALPQAKVYGYATPVIVVSQGEDVTFSNIDTDLHDVVHDVETDGFGSERMLRWCRGEKEDGHDHSQACPLFWTPLLGLGDTARIRGLGNVEPGETYTFFCTRHHGMKGRLIVR